MPTRRPEVPVTGPRAGWLIAVVSLLLVPLLSACLGSSSGPSGDAALRPGQPLPTAIDVAGEIERLLHGRARAIRQGRPDLIARGLVASPAFRAGQRTWYDNLRQLPIERLGFELQPSSLIRNGRDYTATVLTRLQLQGYDDRPVLTARRYRFVRSHGRFLLASVRDPLWERSHDVRLEPWDTGAVTIRDTGHVLGVFDAGSVADADSVMSSVSDAMAQVSTLIPVTWSHRVVVYALSDKGFLADQPRPVGQVDALTFSLEARPGGPVASTRFVLSPRLVDLPGAARDRLVRHELTHVAMGERDDHLPAWLSEGLAEWVSVQALPLSDRTVSRAALAAARHGFTHLPDSTTFNGPDAEANYGLSWFACEYLVRRGGDALLWDLVHDLAGTDDPDRRLRQVVGVGADQLARRAGRLMVATYAGPAKDSSRTH
jgi:hypothetical protein